MPAEAATCIYDADDAEPAWVQNLSPTSTQFSPPNADTLSPQAHQNVPESISAASHMAYCPPSLAWLFAPVLPPMPKLRSLLESYFDNIHPIRVFAFVHRPSFMRMLEEGSLTERSEQALLFIMCALGARFFALEYSESISPLPLALIQSAGSQWGKIAEQTFFIDYSAISVTKLKVLLLLHDHEARSGNYAGSFLLTGLIVRMAHALQLNQEPSTDILCKEESCVANDVSLRECRRRVMWACYMVDVWAGSGDDQLTILCEKDIKLQLPCNERQFLLQIPTVTECLQPNKTLDFIPAADIPERPHENMGMSAYYVRIVHIWQRVLRYIKHLDEVQPPWIPDTEFSTLSYEIKSWKNSHPRWLAFSSDNIYIRRASCRLGALYLTHCLYHHVLCDLHRISLPNLFKIHKPFVFPPEQFSFMVGLQTICFENAQRISELTATILQHGLKYLADPMVPSLVYNSSRIMLYYIARILDRTKPDAPTVIQQTMGLVEQNNNALRKMSQMYPLAEPLYITTEDWLDKVRESIARGLAIAYVAPQDPSHPNEGETLEPGRLSPSTTTGVHSGPQTNSMSVPSTIQCSVTQGSISNAISTSSSNYNTYAMSSSNTFGIPTSSEAIQSDPQAMLVAISDVPLSQPDQMTGGYCLGMENLEQPMFDLNNLQNFFEWENSENGPPPTGVEGLGLLGWNNLSNME